MPSYYPPVGFHFKVNFNIGEGDSDNRFQDVGGLSREINTEELKEGGRNDYAFRFPTATKYGTLSLKRGMLTNSDLLNWINDALENFEFETTNIDVSLLNEEHQVLASWSFAGAYPIKMGISEFKATDNSVVIETLEFAYRFFRRTQ